MWVHGDSPRKFDRWGSAVRVAADRVEADPALVVVIRNSNGLAVGRVELRTPKAYPYPIAQVRILGRRGYGPWHDARNAGTPRMWPE